MNYVPKYNIYEIKTLFAPQKAAWCSRNSSGPRRYNSFTRIEHRACALISHVRYIKILTLLRCCRDKIANFSRLHCLAIPGRDLSTKKTKSNVEKMTRKPRNHVRILRYRTWAIPLFTLESVTYVTVGSSPRYNLFTSTTGRIIVHTATKYGTKPLRYVTFYFRDQRGLASLRHKNHAATTVLVCDEKSYRV